jgi:carnitine O-palmitoyltransferase 1
VVLETKSYKTWTDRGKHLLHGDGATFWFDKSITMLIFADGKMGFNCEHAWGDAPVMGHVTEFALTKE